MRTLVFHWHLPYNHHQIKKSLFIQCCAICSNPPIKILWLDLCNSFCIMGVTSNMATTPPSSNSPALTAHAFFVRRGIRVWPWTQSLRPNQGSASVWRKKLKWAKKLSTDTFSGFVLYIALQNPINMLHNSQREFQLDVENSVGPK